MKKLRDRPINENYPCSLFPCIMTGLWFQFVSVFVSIGVAGMSNPAVFFVLLSNFFCARRHNFLSRTFNNRTNDITVRTVSSEIGGIWR